MSRLLSLAIAASVLGGAAAAQSQLARTVLPDLRRAGVSETCIGHLTQHDFARLKSILDDPDRNTGAKQVDLKFQARRACGEERSLLFELFR